MSGWEEPRMRRRTDWSWRIACGLCGGVAFAVGWLGADLWRGTPAIGATPAAVEKLVEPGWTFGPPAGPAQWITTSVRWAKAPNGSCFVVVTGGQGVAIVEAAAEVCQP